MLNAVQKGQEGNKVANLDAMGIEAGGFKNTLADAGVVDSAVNAVVGTFYVVDETNEDSAILTLFNNGGTKTLAKTVGATAITVTKDTASSVNVYFEAGTLQVQNLTGGEAVINVKYVG